MNRSMNRIRCTGSTLWHRAARPFACPSGSASDVDRSQVGSRRLSATGDFTAANVSGEQRSSSPGAAFRERPRHCRRSVSKPPANCRSQPCHPPSQEPRTSDSPPPLRPRADRARASQPGAAMLRPPLDLALADALALEEIREQGATLLQRHSPRCRCVTTPSSSTCADCTQQCSEQSEKLRADPGCNAHVRLCRALSRMLAVAVPSNPGRHEHRPGQHPGICLSTRVASPDPTGPSPASA